MKKYVINLIERSDRLQLFNETNPNIDYELYQAVNGKNIDYDELKKRGFDTDKDWIDPILKTHLTKGEVGCFLSHYNLWLKCIALDEPIIILEDDAIIGDSYDEDHITTLLETYNFIYLAYKEMGEGTTINDELIVPDYPYWTLAYVITPEAAKKLCVRETRKNVIPVDELLPLKLKELSPVGYKNQPITPHGRSKVGTDVTTNNRYDYFIDFDTHHITVGTDENKCVKLNLSAGYNNHKVVNLGKNRQWQGGTMESTGGGQKINMLREYISMLPDYDVVFFSDAYDVFLPLTEPMFCLPEITRRYLEFKHSIIFSSERSCWPDEELATEIIKRNKTLTPYADTDSPYLNSGLFIGRVSEIKRLICKSIEDSEDDQLYYQQQYLTGDYDIVLDLESYIFQSYDPDVIVKNKQLYNPKTQCFSCVYHGNGGKDAKRQYELLYDKLYGNSPIVYIPTYDYEVIDKDMLLIDFMTPYQCDKMIERAEEYGIFKEADYDKVAGQELRLKQLELWDGLVNHWMKSVYHIVYEYYHPCHIYGVRDAFIIKYAMDSQKSLRLHTDASLVTGSIKLNDDYTGGELVFPRQGVTNSDIPVGKCILFPGQCTHGHTSQELLSGTKYSLTIWTQRFEKD